MIVGCSGINDKSEFDVVLTSYDKVLDYEKEIFYSQDFIGKVSDLCKEDKIFFIKLNTDLYGIQNRSVMVIDNGVILGVFEEVGRYNNYLNIIQTKYGRFALLIDSDIYISNLKEHLQKFECDYVVACISKMYLNDLLYSDLCVTTFALVDNEFLSI